LSIASKYKATDSFPRLPLLGGIALVFVAMGSVAVARLSGVSPHINIRTEAPIATRMLQFEDRKDGSVGIIDAASKTDIAVAAPGTNGFLRGTLRGLMRSRKTREVSYREPFRLERYANGQMVLVDIIADHAISLNAFGPTNVAVFAAFLPTPEGASK
jgi:putative photosynthetic complex assembly protein